MSYLGFVNPALQIGGQMFSSKSPRGIYDITLQDGSTMDNIIPDIVEEESPLDQMEITQHPVEQGAAINDHAYKRPAELNVKFSWSNSPQDGGLLNIALGAAALNPTVNAVLGIAETISAVSNLASGPGDRSSEIYAQLLKLQSLRGIFSVYTGKRLFLNMMLKTIAIQTNWRTENALHATLTFEQLIIVQTQTATLQAAKQKSAKTTASPINKGSQSLKPVSKLSG